MPNAHSQDSGLLDELTTLRARVAELEAAHKRASALELSTVQVPSEMRDVFLRAQDYVERYFAERVEDPRRSTISIAGERYVLVRAASMSVEFFDLVSSLYGERGAQQAQAVAKNLLFDLAHALGKADARSFHARMGVTDPLEKLSAGPVHFSFAGWAFVRLLPGCVPVADERFFLNYEHPFSFESDAWLKQGRRAELPVCIMNAGYSSGWCEESFGLPLVGVEVACQARGDDSCRFIMAPPSRIEEHLEHHRGQGREARSDVEVPEFFQRKRLEDALARSHAMLEQRVRERTAELALANRALESEIAERKLAEAQREKLEAQVRHRQKLESLGVLAGGIAHDFNNLLVGVLGNAGLARLQIPDDSPATRTLESLESAAQRAADLTRQMLAYSSKGRFVLERLDLSAVVREISALLASVVSKNAQVVQQLSPDLPPVEGDATELRQVIMNLLVNASESLTDGKGTIWLRTGELSVTEALLEDADLHGGARAGPHVFIEVEDTGCGMDAASRSRIFDPFFTTKFAGRGLGLAAVLGIVRGHHGIIRLDSRAGHGTKFTVLFPVSDAPFDSPRSSSLAPRLVKGEQRIVLVVDDEAIVREVAARTLEAAGFQVLQADGGEQALQLFRQQGARIALVLLDLTMPQIGGEQLVRALRALDPNVRILLSSGYAEHEAIKRLEGLRGFLAKPYRADELTAQVRAALED